jgi:hypothetical protein
MLPDLINAFKHLACVNCDRSDVEWDAKNSPDDEWNMCNEVIGQIQRRLDVIIDARNAAICEEATDNESV